MKTESRKMQETSKNAQLSWAGCVRTGNRKVFDYVKDFEVVCRFKGTLTRESIYKEIEKTKWSLTDFVGMVLLPGGLVEFNLKCKESALKFAKSLSNCNLESI